MSWRDVLDIGPECKERFVSVTRVPEVGEMDIALAGVSELAGNYHVGRAKSDSHVLVYSVEGEGIVHNTEGTFQVEKHRLITLKANEPFLMELPSNNNWATVWFDVKTSEQWNLLCKDRPLIDYCHSTAQIFHVLIHMYAEPSVKLRAPSVELLRYYLMNTLSKPPEPPPDTVRIDSLFREVEKRLHYPWTVKDMSKRVYYSQPHFHRLCLLRFGRSPMQQVIHLRMERAKYLLIHSPWSLAQIAGHVGYQDVFNFSKRFKKSTGIPPATYRRSQTGTTD